MKAIRLLALLLLLAVGSAGCVTLSDPEVSQEYRADVVAALQPGQSAGQSLVFRRPRANQITIWMRPAGDPQPGQVTFELVNSPEDETPLAVYRRSTDSISAGAAVVFPFAPRPEPAGSVFFVRITTQGRGINLLGRAEDIYPAGQAYLQQEPIDADLAFRQGYDWDAAAALGDLGFWLRRLGLLLPLALALWAPGRLLLHLARADRGSDWGERTALSAGLSLAVIPVLMAWSTLLGLAWTRTGVSLAASLAGALALLTLLRRGARHRFRLHSRSWLHFRWQPAPPIDWLRAVRLPRTFPTSLALLAVILAVLFSRLVMVRDLAGPPWVDSIHHGLITRLILENGAFPETYTPFVDIETSAYHPGFHSGLAVFTWLSGLELVDAMLLYGQVLNVLAVLAVYLFTRTLIGSRPAALLAALLAGLFSPMPAYYTSWGRYTQLAGLVILPAALALVWRVMGGGGEEIASSPEEHRPLAMTVREHSQWEPEERRPLAAALRQSWPGLALAAVACGGLFLTHYRVVAFLGLLLAALFAVRLASGWVRRRRLAPADFRPLLPLALVVLLSVALTLPWWPSAIRTLFVPQLASAPVNPAPLFEDFSWGLLTNGYGRYLLGIAALGFLWALFHRRGFAPALGLWTAGLFLLANLDALWPVLPGKGLVNNTSVEITLYLPLSALGGYLLAWVLWGWARLLPTRWRSLYAAAAVLAAVALGLLGARSLLPILNPSTLLLRQADRPALAWAAENLPQGSAAAINPFAWGYGLYAGQDGGYWLAPSAGVRTLPPPVLSGFSREPEKLRSTIAASRRIAELAGSPAELYAFLREQGIDTVYLGARGGVLSPRALLDSSLFTPVYAQNGVWIFRLDP